jgi:hypothetical protein
MLWTIDDTLATTVTFADLDINYDGTGGGFDFHTDINLDGNISGNIDLSSAATILAFSFGNAQGTGASKTITTVPVLGMNPIEVDFSLDQYYGDTVIEYTCSGNTLKMSGYKNGTFSWVYPFIRQ